MEDDEKYIKNLEVIKYEKEYCGKCVECKKFGHHTIATWKWNSSEDGTFKYDKSRFTWSDIGFLI